MKAMQLCLCVLSVLSAAAAPAETRLGVVGGANFATLNTSVSEEGFDFINRTAPWGGLIVDVGVGHKLSIQLEPTYVGRGSGLRIAPDGFLFDEPVEGSIRLSYLELPLFLKFSAQKGAVRPYVIAGPSIGYLLSAKAKSDGEEEDIKDSFKNVDFGIGVGGGLALGRARNAVVIEARYYFGLADLAQDPDPGDASLRNRGWQVGIAFVLPIGHK